MVLSISTDECYFHIQSIENSYLYSHHKGWNIFDEHLVIVGKFDGDEVSLELLSENEDGKGSTDDKSTDAIGNDHGSITFSFWIVQIIHIIISRGTHKITCETRTHCIFFEKVFLSKFHCK